MTARIIQLDLQQPLPTLQLESRQRLLWLLVKFGPQPMGWIRCRVKPFEKRLTPDQIAKLIPDELWAKARSAARSAECTAKHPARAPHISIVISMRDRAGGLEQLLQSIDRLDYPNFETIVVDRLRKNDRTKQICEKFSFVRRVEEPRAGLDFARNTGWQAASGEIVAFVDENACVDPNWLNALAAGYEDSRVNCVTGITLPAEMDTEAQLHGETHARSLHGFNRRVYRAGTWNASFPLDSSRFGSGANLSVRRSILQRMNGFDVALDAGSIARAGGDLDLMARVLRDGGSIVYEPRAICFARYPSRMSQLRRQLFDEGCGFTAHVMKHARDPEFANLAIATIKRWAWRQGVRRILENFKLAVTGRAHYPIRLILSEIAGGLVGLRAYRRSVRKVRADQAKMKPTGIPALKAA